LIKDDTAKMRQKTRTTFKTFSYREEVDFWMFFLKLHGLFLRTSIKRYEIFIKKIVNGETVRFYPFLNSYQPWKNAIVSIQSRTIEPAKALEKNQFKEKW